MSEPGSIQSRLNAALIDEMRRQAVAAAEAAYAPYSQFRVGAVVVDEEDRIFKGCNVENASFGLTICAERAAVATAVAHGARRLRAIMIFTPTPTLTPPCGACRQVLAEFGSEMEVHLVNDGSKAVYRLADLLPISFGLDR